MDNWIFKHYDGAIPDKLKSSDYITVKNEYVPPGNKLSVTKKDKRKLLPALFYWQWDYSNISKLNKSIPVTNFNTDIIMYANSKNLRQKLNGQKLELTIDTIPSSFSFRDKGHAIFLLFFYVGSEHIFVEPEACGLDVSYRLTKDNTETKKGYFTVVNPDKGMSLKMFQSTKKMVWKYLDQYNNNIKLMSKDVVDKIIAEL